MENREAEARDRGGRQKLEDRGLGGLNASKPTKRDDYACST